MLLRGFEPRSSVIVPKRSPRRLTTASAPDCRRRRHSMSAFGSPFVRASAPTSPPASLLFDCKKVPQNPEPLPYCRVSLFVRHQRILHYFPLPRQVVPHEAQVVELLPPIRAITHEVTARSYLIHRIPEPHVPQRAPPFTPSSTAPHNHKTHASRRAPACTS
jgi:hypothetical protein